MMGAYSLETVGLFGTEGGTWTAASVPERGGDGTATVMVNTRGDGDGGDCGGCGGDGGARRRPFVKLRMKRHQIRIFHPRRPDEGRHLLLDVSLKGGASADVVGQETFDVHVLLAVEDADRDERRALITQETSVRAGSGRMRRKLENEYFYLHEQVRT